jgi:midasin
VSESAISSYKLGAVSRQHFSRGSSTSISKVVYTRYSAGLLEKLVSCMVFNEPCLLVADTGCGKTTVTQHCAQLFGKRLHVFNLSEGSDA